MAETLEVFNQNQFQSEKIILCSMVFTNEKSKEILNPLKNKSAYIENDYLAEEQIEYEFLTPLQNKFLKLISKSIENSNNNFIESLNKELDLSLI